MLKIGFANVMYTLWDVTEETRLGYENKPYKVTVCRYLKTVCKDPAKLEILHPAVPIDLSLKGHSSYEIIHSYDHEVRQPASDDEFKYGKYRGCKIAESTDAGYLKWYLDNGNWDSPAAPLIKDRVSELTGEVFVDGVGFISKEAAVDYQSKAQIVESGASFEFTFENNLGWFNDFNFGQFRFVFSDDMVNQVNSYYGTQRFLKHPKTGKNVRVKGKTIKVTEYHINSDCKWVRDIDKYEIL